MQRLKFRQMETPFAILSHRYGVSEDVEVLKHWEGFQRTANRQKLSDLLVHLSYRLQTQTRQTRRMLYVGVWKGSLRKTMEI